MNTFVTTTSILTHSLAWALLYSLWQGILIYVCLFVLLKALPNVSSRIKYYLSFSAFAALFVWFADTWVTQYQRMKGITVYITQPHFDSLPVTTYTIKTTPVVTSSPSLINQLLHSIEQYIPSVIPIYLAGLAFMLFRFLINIYQLKALRTQGISQPETKWNELLLQWQKQFEITRPVKLFLSNRINVPMMLGTLKPIILLPIATINHLTTEQVEAILLHELAHIKRHDYLLNIFQTIAETILFFNPFVWLISGIIRRQREDCCDDLVVANTASPLPYANALAILEHNRINETRLTLAATGSKNQLLNRIKRIMDMKKKNLNYSPLTIIIVAFIAVAITVAMCMFTPSFAQKAKGNKVTQHKDKSIAIDSNSNKAAEEKVTVTPSKQKTNDSHLVKEGDNANQTINEYKPTYSEDTAIIRFMLKNGTAVWARLADNPLAGKGIIKSLNYGNTGEAINWDEMKLDLEQLITSVYRHINDPRLTGAIETAIDKEIDQQKKFREQYVSIIDSIYVTFEMKDGSKYYVNLSGNPLLNPKIFKGIRSNTKGGYTDWDELRSNYEHAVTEAYKNIKSPELQKEIETAINEEIEEAKIREKNRQERHSSQATLIQELTNDGLIDTAARYVIHYVHDTLYLNNIMQPQNVFDKYSKYFDKNCSISISNSPHTH